MTNSSAKRPTIFRRLFNKNGCLFLALFVLSYPVVAATIVECVQNGEQVYAQDRCPPGTRTRRQVDGVGQSPALQKRSGQRAAPRRSAQEISERAELRRMSVIRKHDAAVERATKKKAERCATLARRVRWSEESRNVNYTLRASERARLKSRHLSEEYQAQCRS
jgi:hypothetical protein